MFEVTGATRDRTRQTIQAAEVFHDKAPSIARACADAHADETVVAIVEPTLLFGGVWTVPTADLAARLPYLEEGGWSLLFSPRTDVADVEARSMQVERLAFARWETMRRWVSRHRGDAR